MRVRFQRNLHLIPTTVIGLTISIFPASDRTSVDITGDPVLAVGDLFFLSLDWYSQPSSNETDTDICGNDDFVDASDLLAFFGECPIPSNTPVDTPKPTEPPTPIPSPTAVGSPPPIGSLDTSIWTSDETLGTLTLSGSNITLDGPDAWDDLDSVCEFPRINDNGEVLRLTCEFSNLSPGNSTPVVGFHKAEQAIDQDNMDGYAVMARSDHPSGGEVRLMAGLPGSGWNDLTAEMFARAPLQEITSGLGTRITLGKRRGALFELDFGTGFEVYRDCRGFHGDDSTSYQVAFMQGPTGGSASVDRIVVDDVPRPQESAPGGTGEINNSAGIWDFNPDFPFPFEDWNQHLGSEGDIIDLQGSLRVRGTHNGNWSSNMVSSVKKFDRSIINLGLIVTFVGRVVNGTGLDLVGLFPVDADGTPLEVDINGDISARGHSFMLRSDNSTIRVQATGWAGGSPELPIGDWTQTHRWEIELEQTRGAFYRVDEGNDGGPIPGGWDHEIDATGLGSSDEEHRLLLMNGPFGVHDLIIERIEITYVRDIFRLH